MVNNPFTLSGKRIVITGAGSGIGRATALLAATMGANLVLIDVNAESLEETKVLITESEAICSVVDLTDNDAIETSIKETIVSGPVDGLVHCAGISSRKPLNMLKRDGFQKVMNVNFYSFVDLVRLFAKRGRMNDGGKIIVMSSISSIRGFKAKTEYCVSKAAVDSFVRCMALELAPRRICVNSVMASEVLTPMALKAKEMNLSEKEFETPLGPSKPEEVASIIAFLLSDATTTITGTSILIDGGACL